MTRGFIIIKSTGDRDKACQWSQQAPLGTKIVFQQKTRSTIQNARMWAMLGDIARQGMITGCKYTAKQWKCIFMQALGREVEYLPELDGSSHFPSGFRSSDLAVREMSDLMEFMSVWGAENAIIFKEKKDE